MLARKITFVLGAGASAELGFPLGKDLQKVIRKACDHEWSLGSPTHEQNYKREAQPISHAMAALKYSIADIRAALKRIRDGVLEAPSIDTFLHNNRHSRAVVDCGKLAIVHAILSAERESPIFSEEAAQAFHDKRGIPGWTYALHRSAALSASFVSVIWDEICQSHTLEDVDAIFKNIAFVNFNYDRSLELSFAFKLKAAFGLDDEAAYALVDSLEIVRPYGSPHGSNRFSQADPEFGAIFDVDLCKSASHIRTFTEAAHATVPDVIKRLMAESKAVVFLGFGFHQQNVDLFERGPSTSVSGPMVYFSLFEGSRDNAAHIERMMKNRLGVTMGVSTSREYRYHFGTSTSTLRELQFPIFRSR